MIFWFFEISGFCHSSFKESFENVETITGISTSFSDSRIPTRYSDFQDSDSSANELAIEPNNTRIVTTEIPTNFSLILCLECNRLRVIKDWRNILKIIRNSVIPVSTREIGLKIDRAWHTIQTHCLKLQIDGKINGFKVGNMNLWVKNKEGS